MKILAAIVLALSLVGCTSGAKPVATYDPAWCEVSEIVMEDGTHLYVYTSPQGNIIIARDVDGKMVGVGTGDHLDLALENIIKKLGEKR